MITASVTSVVSKRSLVFVWWTAGHYYSFNFILVSILVVLFYFASSHFCLSFFLGFHSFVYCETCLNNHLHKTTTCLRWPVLSPPKQTPIQSLLYKMNTCLTCQQTLFLSPKWKKNMSKTTTTKLYPAKKWEMITDTMYKK